MATATEDYHSVPSPLRIQKRLVLNRTFKLIRDATLDVERFTYVTFGGQDLYDVMDLVCVFDVSTVNLRIVSYEMDTAVAEHARNCRVAKTLTKIRTVSIDIIAREFPSGIERYDRSRSEDPFVYFLDYTKVFGDAERQAIGQLLMSDMLRAGDYIVITSCVDPRVTNKVGFMHAHRASFSVFYRGEKPTPAFKARNHVDLHLGIVAAELERQKTWRSAPNVTFDLLRKLRYNDTGAPMGVWVYGVSEAKRPITQLNDVDFEVFPHAFTYYTKTIKAADIFADLFDNE